MTETEKRDLRQSPRLQYEASVELESDDRFYTGFSRNISTGGLFIAVPSPPPVGTRLTVRFRLPTLQDPVEAEAEVRWVRDGSGELMPGMGVRFLSLPDRVSQAIDQYLKQHEALFFDE
ncbi:TIGR02266 family protein [Myxococcota bacterium]|nr:TIGR02266 family protein [Myxococcota bacterium]